MSANLFSGSLISEIVIDDAFMTTCVFLFIGAAQKRRNFLIPWLVVAVRIHFSWWLLLLAREPQCSVSKR